MWKSNKSEHSPLSVIRAKNGHKILDFQGTNGSTFSYSEMEVLLDRKAKLREVPPDERDEELNSAVENFRKLTHCKDIRCYEEVA